MIKFIKKLLLFSIIMVVVDFCVGQIFSLLTKTAKSGDTARNEYIANKVDADVLIFGSSRAMHHYVPDILEDSLGMSCYNCGQDGNGIVLFLARYRILSERYQPKIIIYDIEPEFDMFKGDNHKYIDLIKTYYSPEVEGLVDDIDCYEKYKLHSQMYRFNGKVIQIFADNLISTYQDNKGYRPMFGTLEYSVEDDMSSTIKDIDSLKLKCFEELMIDCQGKTDLYLVVSPMFMKQNRDRFLKIKELSEKYQVPFFDHFSDELFLHKNVFFVDSYHLNDDGAKKFTSLMVKELK